MTRRTYLPLLLAALLWSLAPAAAQAQCPAGNVALNTQADVDNFPVNNPGCADLTGDLVILGNGITDLTPLSGITSVANFFEVAFSADLTSLAGLENITSVGGSLNINGNATLASLDGLAGITSVGGYIHIRFNGALASIGGLTGLTSVGGYFNINDNAALTAISEFNNLTSLPSNLIIENNDALLSIDGYTNLTSIGGNLSIRLNDSLTSCAIGLSGLITDDGSGPAFTGVVGTVSIDTNDVGCSSQQEVLDAYAALGDGTISLATAAPVYWPLDVVPMDIDVAGVTDLLGVGGALAYPSALMTYNSDLAVGAFLDDGNNILADQNNAGSLDWSVARATTGVSGDGTAATLGVTIVDQATPGTASFTLSGINAIDSQNNALSLDVVNGSFEIGGVWPGDADNDCDVDVFDILPIGASYGNTGNARPTTTNDRAWEAKAFSPWAARAADIAEFRKSFADTDGDGTLGVFDVFAIALNFGETRAETTGCGANAPKGSGMIQWALAPMNEGETVTLALDMNSYQEALLGTAFKLAVDPTAFRIESIEVGDLLAGDLMDMVRLNVEDGTGEAAFTRKGAENAAQGSGTMALITLTALDTRGAELLLSEVKVSTADGIAMAGNEVTMGTAATSVSTETGETLPTEFALHGAYPNPFNPTTTIGFDLPEAASVRLVVIDLLGRVVATRDLGAQTAGANRQVQFSAQGLASGTYLYRLEAIGATATMTQAGRFVLLK